jgi:hypothetical protein
MLSITNNIDAETYRKKYAPVAHLAMYAPILHKVDFNDHILPSKKWGNNLNHKKA